MSHVPLKGAIKQLVLSLFGSPEWALSLEQRFWAAGAPERVIEICFIQC
jgi:hypothetical protein